MAEPKVKTIVVNICEPCLAGEGDECHTPGCALFLHAVDLPIHEGIYAEVPANAAEIVKQAQALEAFVSGKADAPRHACDIELNSVTEMAARLQALYDAVRRTSDF